MSNLFIESCFVITRLSHAHVRVFKSLFFFFLSSFPVNGNIFLLVERNVFFGARIAVYVWTGPNCHFKTPTLQDQYFMLADVEYYEQIPALMLYFSPSV